MPEGPHRHEAPGSGRVLTMSWVGTKSTVQLSGDDFRWKFGLRSTWFSF